MKRVLWLFGGLVVVGLVAVSAFAQQGFGPGPGPNDEDDMPGIMQGLRIHRPEGAGMGMMMRRFQALNLSTDQWKRVRQIQQDSQKQVIPKEAEVRVSEIELHQLMQADQPNMSQIEAKIAEIGTKRVDIHKLRVRALMQARTVLTDEQRQKLLDPAWRPEARGPVDLEDFPMLRRRMMRDQ